LDRAIRCGWGGTPKKDIMRRYILLTAATLVAAPVLAGQTSTSPAKVVAASATATAEKLICRSEAPTGSLVPSRKRCYTRAEWDNLAAGSRAVTERIMDDNRSRPNGN